MILAALIVSLVFVAVLAYTLFERPPSAPRNDG